jgi:hypothetical protein
MKVIKGRSTRPTFILLTLFVSVSVWAQESKTDIDVNINKGGGANWYTSPWVWIIGAAVFILLLAALLRGNGKD